MAHGTMVKKRCTIAYGIDKKNMKQSVIWLLGAGCTCYAKTTTNRLAIVALSILFSQEKVLVNIAASLC